MNFYTNNDPARAISSGFSDLDTGLRLHYEFRREYGPYIGLTYESKFGNTPDFACTTGERTGALRFVAGVRVWL